MLETGMKGATGVAYGAGKRRGAVPDEIAPAAAGATECPKCGRVLSAKASSAAAAAIRWHLMIAARLGVGSRS